MTEEGNQAIFTVAQTGKQDHVSAGETEKPFWFDNSSNASLTIVTPTRESMNHTKQT